MNLAIFGGTFDPIHCAHLVVAREAAEQFGMDRVLFIPAANPPHKSGAAAGYEDRYRMVTIAVGDQPGFEASRLESGRGMSYSIDTIEKLKSGLAPGDRLFFIIGADAFADIRTWHRAGDVLRSVEFIAVTRPGHDYDVPEGAVVHRLETVALPVSSSEVRQRLAAGFEPPEVPPPVLAYIRERGLYREP